MDVSIRGRLGLPNNDRPEFAVLLLWPDAGGETDNDDGGGDEFISPSTCQRAPTEPPSVWHRLCMGNDGREGASWLDTENDVSGSGGGAYTNRFRCEACLSESLSLSGLATTRALRLRCLDDDRVPSEVSDNLVLSSNSS